MSDKELIKQEIEKRLSLLWDLIPEGEKVLKDDFTKEDANNLGKYTELENLLHFIDSIPEEHNEDLEEAASKYVREDFHERSRTDFKAGAEWQKQKMVQWKDEQLDSAIDKALQRNGDFLKQGKITQYGYDIAFCTIQNIREYLKQ